MSNLKQKCALAFSLLQAEGPGAVLKELARRYLGVGRPRLDEVQIVFNLFDTAPQPRLMIDVGAHSGTALASFARAGWQIFAFEPDSNNRKKLEDSFGSFRNVLIDPRAVSDAPRANVPLYTSRVSAGISGLSAFHPSHLATQSVDVTTLNTFCEERCIQHVDFLKVDAEGYDLFVLRGAPWHRLTPRVVVCEFEDLKTLPLGYSFHDLARFLQGRGYKLLISEWFPIRRYGGLHKWRRFAEYPCELKDINAWGNIIAMQADDMFDALLKASRRHESE